MKKIGILMRKEMLDILRDKKTLVTMVVLPIVLYPLLIIGMTLVMGSVLSSQKESAYKVAYDAEYEGTVKALEDVIAQNPEEFDGEIEFISAELDGKAAESFSNGSMDAALAFTTAENGSLQAEISYDSTEQRSSYVRRMLEDGLELYREELVAERLAEKGLEESFLYPVTYASVDQVSEAESLGVSLGGSIGMMLIVMIMMGALYPAIDATAGEKERGTLETLLTLPVTNFQMIFSKYVSVAVIACVTAVLSLASLAGSVLFLLYGLSEEVAGEIGFSPSAVAGVLPILLLTMVVMAFLCSALCMCFCVFAKSFKEANNYATPLLLVVMFASMAAMLPSLELDGRTALIPIVNVSLMMKQVLSQQLDFGLAGFANLVNLSVSIMIVWFLAKIYDSENILFADGFRSFRLFQKRSDMKEGTVPNSGDLIFSVTVLFLLLIYVGSFASLRLGFWGTAVNQLMILAVPLFLVWYMKADVKTLFSFHLPGKRGVLGSILLYLGVYCLILVLGVALSWLFPESMENVEVTFSTIIGQPFVVLLLVTALMPAVGEELLFRGLLFGSIRKNLESRYAVGKYSEREYSAGEYPMGMCSPEKSRRAAVYAILISAAVFGVFHMSLVKFFTTAMLGAAFAYIVSVTGSIYITMGLHFLNNAFSMAALKYPEAVERLLPFMVKEQFLGAELLGLLAVGAAGTTLGVVLLRRVPHGMRGGEP